MYEAMTASYHEANTRDNERSKEKTFFYSLLDRGFKEIQNGVCRDVKKRYDPCFDFNIISFTDIGTGKRYSVCQFYVKLKEI